MPWMISSPALINSPITQISSNITERYSYLVLLAIASGMVAGYPSNRKPTGTLCHSSGVLKTNSIPGVRLIRGIGECQFSILVQAPEPDVPLAVGAVRGLRETLLRR